MSNFTALTIAITLFSLFIINQSAAATTTAHGEKIVALPNSEQCQQRLQGRQFRDCQMYVTQVLNMVITKDDDNEEAEQQYMQECCNQLRGMGSTCACEAIRDMVKQMKIGEGSGEMVMKAADLPLVCGISQVSCPMIRF